MSRRILLGGGIVSGVAVTNTKWVKPVLKGVAIPAHADMSPTPWGEM